MLKRPVDTYLFTRFDISVSEPGKLLVTLSTLMSYIISEADIDQAEGIARHSDRFDILPSNDIRSNGNCSYGGLLVAD